MVKRLSNTNQNNNALTNVPTPTNSGDAANKGYVDSAISGAGDVKGPGSVGADGNVALYDGTTGKLLKDINQGGFRSAYGAWAWNTIFTSEISDGPGGGGIHISSVIDPIEDQDAATKKYVDDVFAEESPNNLYVSTVAPSSPNPDDVWVDASSDLGPVDLSGSMGVAIHGTNASYTRPTGYAAITWIGSVQPTNATANDIWYNG